jgi:hypothetical protein
LFRNLTIVRLEAAVWEGMVGWDSGWKSRFPAGMTERKARTTAKATATATTRIAATANAKQIPCGNDKQKGQGQKPQHIPCGNDRKKSKNSSEGPDSSAG